MPAMVRWARSLAVPINAGASGNAFPRWSVGTIRKYGALLVRECREGLAAVLPFTDAERAFLDLLLDRGVIEPTLLTVDASLQRRIQGQPLLQWKALNVRCHKGLS